MAKDTAMTAEERQQAKFIRMTTSPLEKLIISLAIPTIISMMITTFYNMADTFFVGKLNLTSATGAVGVAFSLMSLIQATGFFFGHGSGNFISRELGKKNVKDAEKMASVGFFSAFICGIIIAILGLCFVRPLAKFLGSTDTILPYAVDYIRYILIGTPFICSSFVLNNQLRFQGNSLFAMIGITTGGIINIGLDPLFIFVLDKGVSGAAMATVISQIISFCILLIGIQRSDSLKIRFSNFKPSLNLYKNIANGGLPSLARNGLGSVATIILNSTARGYGDAAIAAMSIVSRIMMFSQSALIGFGQGFQPVCGFSYGAKKYKRVKNAFIFCVKYATIFLTVLAVLLAVFSADVISLFQKNDAQVIEYGKQILRFHLLSLPLAAFVVMSNMMTQTIGKAAKATLLAVSRQGLMLIPSVLILNAIFHITGLFASQLCADILSFILTVPLMVTELKELDRLEKETNNENSEDK